jgi:GTPase SAR1 family protein
MRDELTNLRNEFRETTAMARTILDLHQVPSEARIDSAAGRLAAPYLSILFVGGTQVGKSSLLNAMAGQPISETGQGAATTQNAIFYTPEDIFESDLPFKPGEDRRVPHRARKLAGKVVIDAPDCDSFRIENRARSLELLTRSDVVMVVTSWEKYNQLTLHELLKPEIRGRSAASFVFVVNKMDELSEHEQQEVLQDFEGVLAKLGIERPRLWPISALKAFHERTGKEAPSRWLTQLEALEAFLDERLDRKIKDSNLAREMSAGLVHVMQGGSEGPTAVALQTYLESTEAAEVRFRRSLRDVVDEVLSAHHDSFVSTLRGIVGERLAGGFGTYLSALTYLRPSKLATLIPGARTGEEGLLDGVATSLARRLSRRLTDGLHVYLRRVRAASKDLRDRVPLAADTRAALEAVAAEPMLAEQLLFAKIRPRLDPLTDIKVGGFTSRILNLPVFLLIHAAPLILLYQFLTSIDPYRGALWVLTLPFVLLSILEVERFLYEGLYLRRVVRHRIRELSGSLEESVMEAVTEGALSAPRQAQRSIRAFLDRHVALTHRIAGLVGEAP